MTTTTDFDILVARPSRDLAKEFMDAAHADDFDRCTEVYQALYAKFLRMTTDGFWRPVGHPQATEDGDRMADRLVHRRCDMAIAEARREWYGH